MATLNLNGDQLNIVAPRGKTWTFVVTFPNTTNLTGYGIAWQMRTTPDAATATLSKSLGSGIELVGTTGFRITVPATETTVPVRGYVHEIELTEPTGGKPPFLAVSTLTVTSEVVR